MNHLEQNQAQRADWTSCFGVAVVTASRCYYMKFYSLIYSLAIWRWLRCWSVRFGQLAGSQRYSYGAILAFCPCIASALFEILRRLSRCFGRFSPRCLFCFPLSCIPWTASACFLCSARFFCFSLICFLACPRLFLGAWPDS